jgi:uncharacterized protein (DUF58 family)
VAIDLHVKNKGWLPLPWLELRETLPVALVGPNNFQSVINLGPGADAHFEYSVEARKRGYYSIGPLSISTGDILGLSDSLEAQSQAEALVVYPKIIPFTSMVLLAITAGRCVIACLCSKILRGSSVSVNIRLATPCGESIGNPPPPAVGCR